MPTVDRNLAGDDERALVVAILDDFEQIARLIGGERFGSPVVDKEWKQRVEPARSELAPGTAGLCAFPSSTRHGSSVQLVPSRALRDRYREQRHFGSRAFIAGSNSTIGCAISCRDERDPPPVRGRRAGVSCSIGRDSCGARVGKPHQRPRRLRLVADKASASACASR